METYNYPDCFEKDQQIKNDIVLDTSTINKLLSNDSLLDNFSEKINGNFRVVVPYEAFSEITNNRNTLDKLNKIIKKNIDLRIGESAYCKIKREINNPIKFNLYFKRDIALIDIATQCYEANKQYNKKQKNVWRDHSQSLRKNFLKDFKNITPEERNQIVEKGLRTDEFLKNYMALHGNLWVKTA